MNDKANGNGTVGSGGSDLVERGVSALREKERAIPALPAALVRRTIESVEARGTTAAVAAGLSRGPSGEGWWSMKMVRRYAVAAGLTALAGMAVAWGLLGRGTSVAFADVVEQVRAAKAVRCTLTVKPGGYEENAFDLLMAEPGWVVERGKGMTMIMSSADHKMVTLTEATKQALVMDWAKDAPQRQFNLLETFRSVDGKEGKKLGEREIEGHQTSGFEIAKGETQMRVWADKKTELPVLVEMSTEGFGVASTQTGRSAAASNMFMQMHATFSDFDWNPTYDASELTTEVPAGYTVTNTSMHLQGATEGDVVVMLKMMGEMNGGVMPEGIGARELGALMAKSMRASGSLPPGVKNGTAEDRAKLQQQVTAEAMKKAEPIARGWVFMGDKSKGSEWKYAGGANMGDKGVAVLWYRPTGAQGWRVIDADGAVHEEKEAPQGGEAVKLYEMGPGNQGANKP